MNNHKYLGTKFLFHRGEVHLVVLATENSLVLADGRLLRIPFSHAFLLDEDSSVFLLHAKQL